MPERSALNTSQVSEPPGMVAQSGETRSGMPLSLNRAAADDLDPWIARIVVAKVATTPDFSLDCGLCNDIAFERLLVGGQWIVETADGTRRFGSEPILIGPHSKHMSVKCKGTMSTIGVGFRPGALRKLLGRNLPELVDRIEPGDPLGLLDEGGAAQYSKDATAEDLANLVEERVRAFVERVLS
ncbi:MAG: DUF6597 domain-containing transcriptional factor [Pseudomonadota bacterium]